MVEYVLSSSLDAQNWTYKTDSDLDSESFRGSGKRTVNQTGFYFCANDIMIDENLQFGTFQEAEKNCENILTPKICNNRTVIEKLVKLSAISNRLSKMHSYNLVTRKV